MFLILELLVITIFGLCAKALLPILVILDGIIIFINLFPENAKLIYISFLINYNEMLPIFKIILKSRI